MINYYFSEKKKKLKSFNTPIEKNFSSLGEHFQIISAAADPADRKNFH